MFHILFFSIHISKVQGFYIEPSYLAETGICVGGDGDDLVTSISPQSSPTPALSATISTSMGSWSTTTPGPSGATEDTVGVAEAALSAAATDEAPAGADPVAAQVRSLTLFDLVNFSQSRIS